MNLRFPVSPVRERKAIVLSPRAFLKAFNTSKLDDKKFNCHQYAGFFGVVQSCGRQQLPDSCSEIEKYIISYV
jgi:hypothetical protein